MLSRPGPRLPELNPVPQVSLRGGVVGKRIAGMTPQSPRVSPEQKQAGGRDNTRFASQTRHPTGVVTAKLESPPSPAALPGTAIDSPRCRSRAWPQHLHPPPNVSQQITFKAAGKTSTISPPSVFDPHNALAYFPENTDYLHSLTLSTC